MKKKKKDILPKLTLWSLTSDVIINYAGECLIYTLTFLQLGGLRYAIRALDVIISFSAFSALPFIIQLVLLAESSACLFFCFMAIRSIILLYGVLLNTKRVSDTQKYLLSIGNSCGVDGQQGIGKTRLLVYMLVLHVCAKMRTLSLKYYLDYPIRQNLYESALNGDDIDYVAFKNREDAYEFYFNENPKRIPGAYSNILINWNDKKPFYLQKEHLSMKLRLYEGNVKLLSEADNVIANTLRKSNDKKKKEEENEANAIDEYVGLDRQYNDGILLTDTHANGAIFKSIRDCQQIKLHLVKSEYRYCPDWLKRQKKRIEEKILKSKLNTTIELRKKYRDIESDMRSIGFTHLYYIEETGVDKIKKLSEVKRLVLPNQTPYAYNDRVKQKEYKFAPKVEPKQKEAQEQATKN